MTERRAGRGGRQRQVGCGPPRPASNTQPGVGQWVALRRTALGELASLSVYDDFSAAEGDGNQWVIDTDSGDAIGVVDGMLGEDAVLGYRLGMCISISIREIYSDHDKLKRED